MTLSTMLDRRDYTGRLRKEQDKTHPVIQRYTGYKIPFVPGGSIAIIDTIISRTRGAEPHHIPRLPSKLLLLGWRTKVRKQRVGCKGEGEQEDEEDEG